MCVCVCVCVSYHGADSLDCPLGDTALNESWILHLCFHAEQRVMKK